VGVAACFLGLSALTFGLIATDLAGLPPPVLNPPCALLHPFHLIAFALAMGALWLVLYLVSRGRLCLWLFLVTPIYALVVILIVYPAGLLHEVCRMELPAAFPTIGNAAIAFGVLMAGWGAVRVLWRWVAGWSPVEAEGKTATLFVAGMGAWVILAMAGVLLVRSSWSYPCCPGDHLPSSLSGRETFLFFSCLWAGLVLIQRVLERRWRRREGRTDQNSISAVTE
jgi:hypothetical protein